MRAIPSRAGGGPCRRRRPAWWALCVTNFTFGKPARPDAKGASLQAAALGTLQPWKLSPRPAFWTGRVTVWALTFRRMRLALGQWRLEPDSAAGIPVAAHQDVTVRIGGAVGGGTARASLLRCTRRCSARCCPRGLAGGPQGHAHSDSSSGSPGSAGPSFSGSTHHHTLCLRNESTFRSRFAVYSVRSTMP
jgi:hypothetical protein